MMNQAQTIATTVALSILATVAVAARFFVRRRKKNNYGFDDWFILCSASIMWAMVALIIHGTTLKVYGSRSPFDETGMLIVDWRVSRAAQYQWIVWIFTIASMGLIKLSMVFLYRRIFQVEPIFDFYSIGLIILLALWTLGFLFARIFHCAATPVSNGFVISDIITDLMVLISPMPIIWNMRLPVLKRLGVLAIFALGFLSTAASVTRAYMLLDVNYNYQPTMEKHDLIVIDTNLAIWSMVEISAAIIAACLPTLAPLFRGTHGKI